MSAVSSYTRSFLRIYQQAYPSLPQPDLFSAQAWDAVHIYAQAIKAAGTSKSGLVKEIQTQTFTGALLGDPSTGRISFTSSGYAALQDYILKLHATGPYTVVQK